MDQRAILGQLMILANGRGKEARLRLVHPIAKSLVKAANKSTVDPAMRRDIGHVIAHVRQFACLQEDQYQVFGKLLFAALSKLHAARPPKEDDETKQEESSSSSLVSSASSRAGNGNANNNNNNNNELVTGETVKELKNDESGVEGTSESSTSASPTGGTSFSAEPTPAME
jgi:hypothetical protein